MKLSKLKDSYPKLTSIEVVEGIASGRIVGMWLSPGDKKDAQNAIQGELTEDEATMLLQKFDGNRQSAYNHWDMFN